MESLTLKVFSGEKHERSQTWWIIFFVVVAILILTSLWFTGFRGFLEVMIIGMIVSGYIFFTLFGVKEVDMKIEENGILVGEEFIPWEQLAWYVLEVDSKTYQPRNIVLVFANWGYRILTISEPDSETLENFLNNLSQFLPRLGGFDQSFVERLARILKI